MSLAQRFRNALALALLETEGWTELPGVPDFIAGGGLLLAGDRGALLLLDGAGLDVSLVRRVKHGLVAWARDGGLPPEWRAFSILYVLEHGCPPDLRQEIIRDDPGAALLSQVVQAGFVDLADRSMSLRPGDGVPAPDVLQKALQVAVDESIPLDPNAYHQRLAAEDEKRARFFERLRDTRPSVTTALIAACLAVFGLTWVASGEQTLPVASFPGWVLTRFGSCNGPLVLKGEWWRLVGALFLHAGLVHLSVNMYSLWVIGPMVERFYGHLRLLALFFFAGVTGSLASTWLGGQNSVGASGAIFGLLGAMACGTFRFRDEIPAGVRDRLLRSMLLCIGLNLLIGFSLAGTVDNWAHLGGLLGGVLFALVAQLQVVGTRLPQGPIARQLALLTLCALALVPIAVEGYVLARAWQSPASWSTTYAWQDPLHEFRLQVPTPLSRRPEMPGEMLVFATDDGSVIVLVSVTSWPAGDDLERAPERHLESLAQEGLRAEQHEIRTVDRRRWLVVNGSLAEGRPARAACTVQGKKRYCLVLVTSTAGRLRGEQALDAMLASFQPR